MRRIKEMRRYFDGKYEVPTNSFSDNILTGGSHGSACPELLQLHREHVLLVVLHPILPQALPCVRHQRKQLNIQQQQRQEQQHQGPIL